MNRFRDISQKLHEDEKFGKRTFLITLVMALFVLTLVIRTPDSGGKYIVDKNNNLIGIVRSSLNTSEVYDLNLSIVRGEEIDERSIQINKQATQDKTSGDANATDKQEAEMEAELNGIITEIELSDDKKISLPAKLSDGSRLIWSVNERAGNSSFLILLIAYVVLMALVVKSSIDSDKDVDKEVKQNVLMGLPRFTNQLLLMMNAGMILSDAVEKICSSYKLFGEKNMNYFEKEMVRIAESNLDHRSSIAVLINDFAASHNVKELMRIATILTENERRGSDVIDNLERESRYLWDDRKIVARERGKMIDTKMSYPLAILLVLLIVITMAPAMLNL